MSDQMWENAVQTMKQSILENEYYYDFLLSFEPNKDEGYTWTKNTEYKSIADDLDTKTGYIHSGASFSVCLRASIQEIKIEQLIDNNSVPNEYICPISHKIMIEPVTTSVGNTYEEKYIKKWFENHDTDPLFNETLKNKNLIHNNSLKETMNTWIGNL
jgi:hypothetical protein